MDQEREELKQRERRKRSRRMEVISTLTELGYSRRDAARALHLADGDVDRACAVSTYLSVCLPVCLSTCLSVYLSVSSPSYSCCVCGLQILLDSSQAALLTNNNTEGVSPEKVEQVCTLHVHLSVSMSANLTTSDQSDPWKH